jgi:hypothetical protein
MPLARIITRNPQSTILASDYLRSQGYMVETVSPGEFRVTPAELELNLEKCGPQEALARAKALLESPENAAPAETSVEPVQPEKAKVAIGYDIAGRPVEFAEEGELLSDRRTKPNSIVSALVSMLARAKQGIASGIHGTWDSVRKPLADFQRERAEQRALKLEAELAQEREEVRYHEELARERLRQEMTHQRDEAELAERQRQERIAAEREAEERRRIAAEKAAAEERERQRIKAERAAALAAQQEQARFEAERQAAASRAQQQPTPNIPAEMAAESGPTATGTVLPPALGPEVPQKATVSDYARQQLPHRSSQRAQPFVVRRPRAPIRISRKAVVTALGASLLVLLGFIAFANRRPASPLSPGALMRNQSVKQDTPFGAATITPAPATAPKPSAAVAPAKTSPAARSATAKPRATRRSARRLRPRAQDDPVAEDEVVVRHLQSARPRPQPTASNAKLRQYSDTE